MSGWSVYTQNSGAGGWSVYRMGAAAAATSAPGGVPAYGMAYDLSTLPMDDETFADYARTQAEISQSDLLAQLQESSPAMYSKELEIAQNHEKFGLSMENESFGDADAEGVLGFLGNVQAGFRQLRNVTGQAIVGAFTDESLAGPSYEEYKAYGGILSQSDWDSFSESTQRTLRDRAQIAQESASLASQPGISQLLYAAETGYRGVTTFADMAAEIRGRGGKWGQFNPASLKHMGVWFDGDEWSKAWRESEERSLGNALIDNTLSPIVAEDTLDEWRRTNPLYQMSSIGAEFTTAWYADLGVIAARGAGNAMRVARNEMPLNANSRMYTAIREAEQGRDIISVRTPLAQTYAAWRAERILEGKKGVEAYGRAVDLDQFARLPMFNNRAANGLPAAAALHIALRSDNPDLLDLSWRVMDGDAEAWAKVRRMREDATVIDEMGGDARTFLDALEATKTKIPVLEQEILDLNASAETGSMFHRWEVHTEAQLKEQQIARAKGQLESYGDDYAEWLGLLTEHRPHVNRYGAPKSGWSDADVPAGERPTHRFYMNNQYGFAHRVTKLPKAMWMKKTNTASMHDFDSGRRAITRSVAQWNQILDFDGPDVEADLLSKYSAAQTAKERYKVLYDMEETHLVPALAAKLGISEELTRKVMKKVDGERGRSIRGMLSGKGRIYSTAPSTAQRLTDQTSTARLVSEPDDEGMVTLELMDGNTLHTVTVHESSLAERVDPVDPTQTPNYYQPADVRRLYLEMKRHKRVLDALDAGFIKKGLAEATEINDIIGTKFYALWKPAQLWRLGWPQRVLMDEGLRAMSVYGPAYWLTGPGIEAVTVAARNIPSWMYEKYNLRRKGGLAALGPGPVTRAEKRDVNPFEHDAKVVESPKVRASEYPKINKSRYDRLQKVATASAALGHAREVHKAAKRAVDDAEQNSVYSPTKGIDQLEAELYVKRELAGRAEVEALRAYERLNAPVERIARHVGDRMGMWSAGYRDEVMSQDVPQVFDPTDGKDVKSGFFVPLPGLGPKGAITDPDFIVSKNMAFWFEQNTELLSRSGIRIQVDLNGNVEVGRLFTGHGAKAKATRALKEIAEQAPVGSKPREMFDLSKRERYVAEDANKLSPMMEALHRYFWEQNEPRLEEGISPAEGAPQVFHGGNLPITGEDGTVPMLPRDEAPLVSGDMVGRGFYTTVDIDIAREYAYSVDKLYTIRNSKTGEQYEVFDLDQEMTQADFDEFRATLDPDPENFYNHGSEADTVHFVTKRQRAMNRRGQGGVYAPFRTKILGRYKQITWGNYFENLPIGSPIKAKLTEFLENKGAGALTHLGGTAHGKTHQVYVWLKPEELDVIPAYAKSDKWQHLEGWFTNPASRELPVINNPIPENRIVRYGRRNPMLRELHTTHAQLEARKEALKSQRKGWFRDTEAMELLRREQSLMHGMGLEYKGRASGGDPDLEVSLKPNAFGQDWYEVDDPDKFNRMFDQAEGMNGEVDWAAAANGDLRAQEVLANGGDRAMDVEDFDLQIDNLGVAMAKRMRKEYGSGYTSIRNPDGSTFDVPNAFEGHQGELMKGLVSSNKAIDDLSDGHGGALKLLRTQAQGHKVYHPPAFTPDALKAGTEANKKAVNYFHQWADLVNNQIGNSPIWHRMLKGQSDEAIVRWLIETGDGAAVRREMGRLDPNEGSVALWVNEHRAALDMYVPSKKVQRLLAKGRVKPSDLRRNVHDDDLPDVFGPDVELIKSNFFGRLADSLWNALGTVPIDAISRHPFAKATYDTHMRSLIASSDAKWLDDDAIKSLQDVARTHTLNEVRKTLFDLTDATNMTDALRFIAPFWNAQQEAITKWMRIISDRPETVARFFNGTRAVYKNFVIQDEEGNEVETSGREGGLFGLGVYHPTDKVILNIPDWMRKGPLGKSLAAIGETGIPMGSANTVLQGEFPLFPSTGPYVTIPIDKFLRTFSDTYGVTNIDNDAYRWLFPIGRPAGGARGIMEQLSPGWGRRVMGATGPEDAIATANLFWQVGREMQLEAQRKGEPMPTNEEIEKATKWLWGLRIVTGMVSPVQVEFRPKNQMWVDEAHRYRQQFGAEWFDKYVEDYGKEAAIYAISSTNSVAGVPPTTMGAEEWEENAILIQKFPHWGEAIISPEAYADEYNQDFYRAQGEINLGPGDSRVLRDVRDPAARLAEAQERLGWLEFRKVSSAITAELYARGLTNIQQVGAEDLTWIKAQAVAELSQEYPAWRSDYDTFSNNIDQRVGELQSFAFDKEFDKRPDIQGVRQYLIIREQAASILDQQYAAGGSRSLQSEENTALRQWFYGQVGQLIEANPAFAEFYSRFLDGDSLMKGSG